MIDDVPNLIMVTYLNLINYFSHQSS